MRETYKHESGEWTPKGMSGRKTVTKWKRKRENIPPERKVEVLIEKLYVHPLADSYDSFTCTCAFFLAEVIYLRY